ncbi:hypothetical protein ACVGXU_15245, partial [Enterobacter hormaechei]
RFHSGGAGVNRPPPPLSLPIKKKMFIKVGFFFSGPAAGVFGFFLFETPPRGLLKKITWPPKFWRV